MSVLRKFTVLALTAIVSYTLLQPSLGRADDVIEIRTIGIPPYGIQDDNGFSGAYYEIVNLLTQSSDHGANNLVYPYARIINELKTGQTDMTIMFKYTELEEHVDYIAPLPALKIAIFGLKGVSYDSIDSLKGKTVAYLRGAKFSDKIDSNPEIFKASTTDFKQGLEMMIMKHADAIIGPAEPILSAAKTLSNEENFLGEPLIIDERTPWVQISKHGTQHISKEALKVTFQELKDRGEIDAIRHKYTKNRWAE